MSKPQVFIIESLTLTNEAQGKAEGSILRQILGMLGKEPLYYYIRTRKELTELLREFTESQYRYLHLSCHGSSKEMETTFDAIPITQLGGILSPHLDKRRLFLSACKLSTTAFAKTLLPSSGCYSIAGPASKVRFEDAALLWASFYRLMFGSDTKKMKHADLERHLRSAASLFQVSVNLYYQTNEDTLERTLIRPVAV